MNTGPKFSATLAMIASYSCADKEFCAPASPPWPSSQAVSWANCYSFFNQSVEADCWFQSLFSWIHPGILEFKWIHQILSINPFSISITFQLMPWFFDGWLQHQRLVYHHEGLWPPFLAATAQVKRRPRLQGPRLGRHEWRLGCKELQVSNCTSNNGELT